MYSKTLRHLAKTLNEKVELLDQINPVDATEAHQLCLVTDWLCGLQGTLAELADVMDKTTREGE